MAILPVPGVQDQLDQLASAFDLHFATSRLPKARRTTIQWLENYKFPLHDLHFLKHGEKHASLGNFYAAVEDHYEQAVDFAKTRIRSYLIEHPWNKGKEAVDNLRWVLGWPELVALLLGDHSRE